MKKIAIAGALALCGLTVAPHAEAAPAHTCIYFIPHEDDETLTFSPGIVRDIKAHDNVILVLVTDGAHSNVKNILTKEGYPLTSTQFVAARQREFVAASMALGVKKSNLFMENLPDGGVDVDSATKVINKWSSAYKGATLNGESWIDAQPDHAHLGEALNMYAQSHKVAAVFWENQEYFGLHDVTLVRTSPKSIAGAINAYKVWNPSKGYYSIGYISVGRMFNLVESNPVSGVHGSEPVDRWKYSHYYMMAYWHITTPVRSIAHWRVR